jgi:hypothetical protein
LGPAAVPAPPPPFAILATAARSLEGAVTLIFLPATSPAPAIAAGLIPCPEMELMPIGRIVLPEARSTMETGGPAVCTIPPETGKFVTLCARARKLALRPGSTATDEMFPPTNPLEGTNT